MKTWGFRCVVGYNIYKNLIIGMMLHLHMIYSVAIRHEKIVIPSLTQILLSQTRNNKHKNKSPIVAEFIVMFKRKKSESFK